MLFVVLLNNLVKYSRAAASLMNELYEFTMYSVYVCICCVSASTCSCNVAFFVLDDMTHASCIDAVQHSIHKRSSFKWRSLRFLSLLFALVISIFVHVYIYTCSVYSDWNTKRPFFVLKLFLVFPHFYSACSCRPFMQAYAYQCRSIIYLMSVYVSFIHLPLSTTECIVISFAIIWFTGRFFYWVVKNKNATCFCIH